MNDLMTLPINLSLPELAVQFAQSGFFPSVGKAQQALVKIIAGRELGMGPFASMTGIHLIQGRPEVGSHQIASALKRSPKYDYRVLAKSATECRIRFLERMGDRWESLGEEVWTIQDAQRAGLAGKGTWAAHPAAMLFARCISSGYRTYCPDVFEAAVYVDGEISEPLPAVARIVEPEPAPPMPEPAPPMPAPAEPEILPLPPERQVALELIEQLEEPTRAQGWDLLVQAGVDTTKLDKLSVWAQKRLSAQVSRPAPEPAPDSDLVLRVRDHLDSGHLTAVEVEAYLAAEGAAVLRDLPEPRLRYLDARGRWASQQKGA
jgi:hypothetical protein